MSRVRKPPGGDSSFNIFGVATEPSNAKKATENNNQKAADNSVQKTTDNGVEKATELHVKTDEAVAKEDPCEKTQDKNEDDKEKEDVEVEEEEKEKKEELKDGADQVSANAAAPATSVDVKDSPTKSENQNTPESKKSQPKVAYNPITGQPYGSPEKPETETKSVGSTTRVRQPPGGASSKLW